MTYAELIQLFFERSNALQWYWTLYVVIIGGLLAFSSLRVRPDPITGILVTILFTFFAYKNLGAIVDVSQQRIATVEAIRQYPADAAAQTHTRQMRERLEPTLITPDIPGIHTFHITTDVLTIATIWAMELRRIRAARNPLLKPA